MWRVFAQVDGSTARRAGPLGRRRRACVGGPGLGRYRLKALSRVAPAASWRTTMAEFVLPLASCMACVEAPRAVSSSAGPTALPCDVPWPSGRRRRRRSRSAGRSGRPRRGRPRGVDACSQSTPACGGGLDPTGRRPATHNSDYCRSISELGVVPRARIELATP